MTDPIEKRHNRLSVMVGRAYSQAVNGAPAKAPGSNIQTPEKLQAPGSRTFFTTVLLLCFLPSLRAQPVNLTVNTNVYPYGARYLFVVETSSTTRRMSAGIQKAAADLLGRDLAKQLRAGDTIGLWTYDKTLHTGRFPLQLWAPDSRLSIATNIVDFLSRQNYRYTPNFNGVVPALADLIQSSEKLTILIISAGDSPIIGTPFDDTINATYYRNRAALKKQDLPFITMIRAWRGDVIGGSVSWPPWPMDFPKFPPGTENSPDPQAPAAPTASACA